MVVSTTLICVLFLIAIVITVLMRPDIFFSVLRGGREKSNLRLKPKVLSDRDFQSRLKGGH